VTARKIADTNVSSSQQHIQEVILLLDKVSDIEYIKLIDSNNSNSNKHNYVSFISGLLFILNYSFPSLLTVNRKKICLEQCIKSIYNGSMTQEECRGIFDLVNANCDFLSEDQAKHLIDMILDSAERSIASTTLTYLYDLLPSLIRDSSECREHVVSRLYQMDWAHDCVVVSASCLTAVCVSAPECERAINKLTCYIKGNSSKIHSTNNFDNTLKGYVIDPEDIPLLVYHLTSLSKKCSSGTSLRLLLINVLSDSLDCIMQTAINTNTATAKKMRNVISTIMLHLSTMVVRDQVSLDYIRIVSF
jgi:hypothetical protein